MGHWFCSVQITFGQMVYDHATEKNGGLNIRDSRLANVVLVAKIGGQLAVGVDTLWVKVLCAKYLRRTIFMECVIRPTYSPTWKGIIRSFHRVKEGFGWCVGHDSFISFWFDI